MHKYFNTLVATALIVFTCGFARASADITDINPSAEEKSIITALVREFVDVLESEDTSHLNESRLRTLMRRYNFKNLASKGYRMYRIKSEDPRLGQHAANLAFVLPITEMTEVFAAPILTTISTALGLPEPVTGTLGVVGLVTAFPMVDPVCAIFIVSYVGSRPFRNSITWLRSSTMSSIRYMGDVTGINKWLTAARDFFTQGYHPDLLFLNDMKIEWGPSFDGRVGIQKITMPVQVLNYTDYDLQIALKTLPLDFRFALGELIGFLQKKRPRPFYLKNVESDVNVIVVEWLERSVSVPEGFCKLLLRTL